MPNASENDERPGIKNKTFTNSPKREMQPWLLTKSVYINTKSTLTTQRSVEEITTDKAVEEQTEIIISDWLSERKTTTEEGVGDNNNAKPEETTSTLDTTTLNLDSNIIKQDKPERGMTHVEESSTFVDGIETTTQRFNDNNEEEKELEVDEIENQTEIELNTDYSATTTTTNPNAESDSTEKSDNSLKISNISIVSPNPSDSPNLETTELPAEDVFTTEVPETTSFLEKLTEYNNEAKQEESQTEVHELTTISSTTDVNFNGKIKDYANDSFTESNKPTETTTGSILSLENVTEENTNSPNIYQHFEIPLQNGKSTNEKRSGVNYEEGSGEDSIDDENDTDSILHEELSADFESIETTKFADHNVVYTTPFTVEDHIVEEANKKIVITEADNEIKENISIIERVNYPTVFEQQTKEPVVSTTTEYNTIATTLPSGVSVYETKPNDENTDLKQSEVVSTTLFEDNVMVKVVENLSGPEKIETLQNSTKNDEIIKDDLNNAESVTMDEKEVTTFKVENFPTTQLETTTKPEEIIESLKEVLTKEDINESELEEDSVEQKNNKVKKNSEEFEIKGSNEEEGEDNQQPPVLELNNQLSFLQLGGHGSSESSSTSESYSSEVNVKENNIKSNDDNLNDHPLVRTVPESQADGGNKQPNTSTHITLTPGDLKILAEYLINEKIKPISRPINETSNYMPTEWLKGNLTSDVKIASILTAANISIGIMNKTNIESKIKSLEDVEHLMNVGKTVESKDPIVKLQSAEPLFKESVKNSENEEVNEKTELENRNTNKNIDSSTISTRLSLLTDKSTIDFVNLEPKDKDDNVDESQSDKNHQETQTEKINFETEIFEVVTTKNSEPKNNLTIDELVDKTSTEETMTTIIPKTTVGIQTAENESNSESLKETKGKNSDVSASRKVRIPEIESIVKAPFSVNLEDNDLTIMRDFLKKHMVIP